MSNPSYFYLPSGSRACSVRAISARFRRRQITTVTFWLSPSKKLGQFVSLMNPPQEHNRQVWDKMAQLGLAHTEVAGEKQFSDPWTFIDDCGWLGHDVAGKRVLCLAAGGGWHGPLFASVGARVTVVDISPEMLARD